MKKQFDKRSAALGLSVVLALVLGVAAISKIPPASANYGSHSTAQTQTDRAASGEPPLEDQEDASADPSEEDSIVDEADCAWEDDTPDASWDEAYEEPLAFVMPEDAEYEPEVALVSINPSASAQEVADALSDVEGVLPAQVSDDDIASGYIRLELAEGTSVEDAVNGLLSKSVVEDAQPNYVYEISYMLDGSAEAEDGGDGDPALQGAVINVDQGGDEAASVTSEDEPGSSTQSDEGDAQDSPSDYYEAPSVEPVDSSEGGGQAQDDDFVLEVMGSEDGEDVEEVAESAEEEDTATDVDTEASAADVNDPSKGNQWGLSSIRAYEAWYLQKANRKVTVAVMDAGFDVSHPDLKDNIACVYNAIEDQMGSDVSPLGTDYTTRNHGMHVAGIISAVSNNGVGISGASYNARIMPIMMFKKEGNKVQTDSYAFENALNKIVELKDTYNIRVVNISIGSDEKIGKDNVVSDGIKECYDNGILVVASAGNLSDKHTTAYAHFPSDDPNCVAVMSLEESDEGAVRLTTSNYNRNASDHKDLCAPGKSIYSTIYDKSGYGTQSGTSMAAPFVSATAALVFAANPSLTTQQAIDILHGTATDLGATGWDVYYGYGEVNAYFAVYAAKNGLTAAQNERAQERKRDAAATNSVLYRTHVQNVGWQTWKSAGEMSGTSGRSLRLEGIEIKLSGAPYSGGIRYRTHVQNVGWQGWRKDGAMSGTNGKSLRLEAIQIELYGDMADYYDVWYRVHAQDYGWLGWAKNGARAGTATYGKRLEGIEVRVTPKGSKAPGTTSRPYVTRLVSYRTHVQNVGWQGRCYDGATSGTSGRSLRLEGIDVSLADQLYSGGIKYRTHVQNIGWQGWRYDGSMSGTSGRSLRLEAIQIELYGNMADHYDVWYRVHAQNFGWMGWASNGKSAGTAGYSYRLEAVQIRLVPKGAGAPGSTANAFRQR